MSLIETARRWAQNNPQFATTLATMAVFAAFGAMGGGLADFGGGFDPTGGTTTTPGP
ncbi:hypothetical protein [Halorubellus salinus]|uniref:hypothetical protein n=1 Tax=Halorubellus salinus TaxID=755309 RepID=UPI001D0808B3|nr:hypothetical protein [Halorubellus salinus]